MGPARLETINIAPYNQVLALTQHMINQGIDNLYTQLQSEDEVHESQEPAVIELDRDTSFEGVTFGPPNIIIDADFSNVRSVRLRINLKSGTANMSNYLGRNKKGQVEEERMQLRIENWTITIPVDVGFVKLEPGTQRYKAVQDRSAAKGKPNHSIYELLVDLTTMASGDAKWDIGGWDPEDKFINKEKKTVTPQGYKEGQPRSYADMEKGWQNKMKGILIMMVDKIAEWNLHSMGFAIQADDNKPATFEVNNVRYMTYPWIDPNTKNGVPAGLSGDGRLNYLLYLETVGAYKPVAESDPSSVLSTRMGNWTEARDPTVDSPSKFGSFVLSSNCFMDNFLLPKLSCINRVMSADISSVEAKAWSEWLIIYYRIRASWGIGQGEWTKEATDFALRRDTKLTLDVNGNWPQDLKDHMRPLTESPGHGATIWAYKDVEYGNTAKSSSDSSLGLDVSCSGDTICYSRAYTLAGDNKIVFEGRIWTKVEYLMDPPIGWKERRKITAKVQWKVTFTLGEVSDGGMQIRMDTYTPTPEVNEEGDGDLFKSYKTELIEGYNAAFENFNYYLNDVRNSLQGQEKFTLPASGVFYFKDPMMDSFGNLICGLEYNGNPKKAVNPDAVDRVGQPQASYTSMPAMVNDSTKGERKKA